MPVFVLLAACSRYYIPTEREIGIIRQTKLSRKPSETAIHSMHRYNVIQLEICLTVAR
jgi:hypothetical protein